MAKHLDKSKTLPGYVGPLGPHLNCLTQYSIKGERRATGTMHPLGRRNPHKGYRMKRDDKDQLVPICG